MTTIHRAPRVLFGSILEAVKSGATPLVREVTEKAATFGGLSVYCGGGAYRPFPHQPGGDL